MPSREDPEGRAVEEIAYEAGRLAGEGTWLEGEERVLGCCEALATSDDAAVDPAARDALGWLIAGAAVAARSELEAGTTGDEEGSELHILRRALRAIRAAQQRDVSCVY